MADPKHPTVPGAPIHSLFSGEYLIESVNASLYVAAEESKPLVPRKVFTLPGGTLAPKWSLERIDERRFYIRIDNNPAAIVGQKVFAIQIWQPQVEHQLWVLENRPQQGENVFTITSVDGALSWVVESHAAYTQVAVRKLGVFIPENPPRDALFKLSRVH